MNFTIHIPLEAFGALVGLTIFFAGVFVGVIGVTQQDEKH